MATKRTYGDRCGIARALDIVGERWALLVVRELLIGPKRFTDLRRGLPRVGPDILSERLRELERSGVVHKRRLDPPASGQVYELTERGRGLEPVVLALGRWGSGAPVPSEDAPLGPDAMMIALKTMFDPAAAGDVDSIYAIRLGEDAYSVRVAGGQLAIDRGAPVKPDAAVSTDPATLAQVLWHGVSLPAAEQRGELQLDGSRAAFRRLLKLFAAPAPA